MPHQGVTKTRKAAQELYYWPGINNDFKTMIDTCVTCAKFRPSVQAEKLRTTHARGVMTNVSVDLFAGENWLAMVDYYSGYLFGAKLKRTATSDVINELQKLSLIHI